MPHSVRMNKSLIIALAATVMLFLALVVVVVLQTSNKLPEEDVQVLRQPQLSTTDVCWQHAHGHVCLRDHAVQFLERNDRDTITVQEIIGSQQFTYNMVNTDALYREVSTTDDDDPDQQQQQRPATVEGVDSQWIDDLVGWKYNCVVEDMEEENEAMNDLFEEPAILLVSQHDDGGEGDNNNSSSVWKVGAWLVTADSNLVPRTLASPPASGDDDESDDDDEFTLTITGMNTFQTPIVGCDPNIEAGDENIPYRGPSNIQMQAVLDVASGRGIAQHYDEEDQANNGTRSLGAFTEFQALATQTNWCGSGTPKSTTPCPSSSTNPPNNAAGGRNLPLYDYRADRACRRHDYGKRFSDYGGIYSRTECLIDQDLVMASDNLAIEAVFGRYGLAATFGCYGFGNYKCWKRNGWRLSYGCHCRGERIRFGFGRYDNNERNPKWGYHPPEFTCSDDLWSCSAGAETCETIQEPKASEGSC